MKYKGWKLRASQNGDWEVFCLIEGNLLSVRFSGYLAQEHAESYMHLMRRDGRTLLAQLGRPSSN